MALRQACGGRGRPPSKFECWAYFVEGGWPQPPSGIEKWLILAPFGSHMKRLLKKRGLDRKTARCDASPYQNTRIFEGRAKPPAEPGAFFNSHYMCRCGICLSGNLYSFGATIGGD